MGVANMQFAPFIMQSVHATEILIDNRPCVRILEKLVRGEVSSSLRVSTFLSTAATVFRSDTSTVLQSYHETLKAAIFLNATTRFVRFVCLLKRWLYSVFPWAMSSAVLPRCHPLAVLSGMPLTYECPDLRHTHVHYTLTPALLEKPPDGPIRGQDMCSDSFTDSERESPEPAGHGQVVADGQLRYRLCLHHQKRSLFISLHPLRIIRPNLRTHPVHLLVDLSALASGLEETMMTGSWTLITVTSTGKGVAVRLVASLLSLV